MSDNYMVFFPNPEFGAQKAVFVGYFWENASFLGILVVFGEETVLFLGGQRKEFQMRKKDYKGRCMKKTSPKSETVCRLYDDLQISFLKNLEADDDVISIQTNAPLDDLDFTSDFLCRRANGDFMLRECVYRKYLTKPLTAEQLDLSRMYWAKHGVVDWGVVIDAEK